MRELDNSLEIAQSLGLTSEQLIEMPDDELIKLMKSKPAYQAIVNDELIMAIIRGDAKYVEFMLTSEVLNINANPDNSGTPLMHAIANEEHDVVRALLKDPRIDVNAETNDDGLTALMLAAGCNDVKSIKALLGNKKIDVNRQDCLGRTALMYLALQEPLSTDWKEEDSIEAAKILLEDERVNADIRNNDGLSAEDMAARHGFVRIKEFFKTARLNAVKQPSSACDSGCINAARAVCGKADKPAKRANCI